MTCRNAYDGFSAFQYSPTPACTSVSMSTVPCGAATAGNLVTVRASATGCSSPQFELRLKPPGGAWTLAQGYSPSATLKWSSAGQPGGTYRFSVWARDATSQNMYDAFEAIDYTVMPVCSAVSASTVPASAATAGNNISVTGTASGCPNPLYEFWVLAPGGSWTLAQAYSTSPTFKWTTAGKTAGSNRISVWVRHAGRPVYSGAAPYTYDSFSSFMYSLV